MLTHEEFIEIGKIMSDFFKQMITLDTGVIVLISTIVEKVFTTEKVFRARRNLILLVASVLSFVRSFFLALKALVVIPSRFNHPAARRHRGGVCRWLFFLWDDLFFLWGCSHIFASCRKHIFQFYTCP